MFVKKLVEKASMKKPGTVSGGLKAEDIDPRLVFHYGIPSGAVLFAFDSIQKILAIATKDGRIKLFGKDGTQALLEHSETVPSKFLEFMENRGILININASNHIEVWDVARKELTQTYEFEREITSYSVLQHTPYMFVGDSNGNVSVMKHSEEANQIEHMQYRIPYSPSHGNSGEISSENAVTHVLPQPLAESKRLVIVYKDGLIVLWSIQESRTVFTTGATAFQSISHEAKQVTAASWACPTGSKIAVGYNNGEIFIWSIPAASNLKSDQGTDKDRRDSVASQSAPICKLNLGYKLDKIPISKLRWLYVDGKASRLYVMGFSSAFSANLMQVLLLNEKSESRTIKVGLNPPETCIDFNILTGFYGQGKQKNDAIILLGKSGQIYYYDDSLVERYLLLSQSKSSPSLPKEEMVKLPFAKTRITVSFFVSDNPVMRCSADQDYITFTTDILQLFPFQTNPKDASVSNQSHSSGFSKAKNLYITGHDNGAIDFWDISCPLLSPIVSLTQQSEDDLSVSGVPLVSLYFDLDQRLLISGDQNGTVRIYKLKSEVFIPESGFLSLPGGSKKGGNHIVKSIKLLKVNGAALCINTGNNAKHLAVGSDQGYVSLFDMEGQTLLYQKHIASELCTGIMSLQFGNCSIQGFDKNLLMVATKDSSVLAFESETGNSLSSSVVCPKSPSRALYMQILDGYDISSLGSNIMDVLDMSKGTAETASRKQQVLLMCSERAVYVYSLSHAVQGIKKVLYKKKFHSTCCWASTFESPEAGVILVFSTGQIDIRPDSMSKNDSATYVFDLFKQIRRRSLPELSHLRTFSVRGLTLSVPKANSIPNHSVCSSHNGDLVVVSSDQEAFFVSLSLHKEAYGYLEFASRVYNQELVVSHDTVSSQIVHKEKKKGIFSSVMKDITGAKPKNGLVIEAEEIKESLEDLSAIFSAANFPSFKEREEKLSVDKNHLDLDIDDIDIEDPGEKPKGNPTIAGLSKQNFTNKFQAIKGKFKHIKVKSDKTSASPPTEDDKSSPGSVDQIKKKYGFSSYSPKESSGPASMAKIKLSENMKKLQGISMKTAEMQDTAQSFSSMAKEVLRLSESDKRMP